MLLTLCYVFPPLAVLFMGRPFAAIINMFMILGGWSNMVKHALVCYADRRGSQYVNKLSGAVNNPSWTKGLMGGAPQQSQLPESEQGLIDDPCVGANGTNFKKKIG